MGNMRQVIKTNHNFMTGEHYEQRVLKPVQASHNRVTIQLCDAASGQVIEEAVTENAITPLFECNAYGSIAQQLNNMALNGGFVYPSFKSIVLSDSDISELEDLWFIHGNIVGICNRTDTAGAGNNQYRGTCNSAETYKKFEDNGYMHIHLVYDWPTSSGNGKIQNIYWLPIEFNFEQNPIKIVAALDAFNNAITDTNLFFDKRGNTYRKVNNKYYKVLNLLKYINGIEAVKLATDESFYNKFEVNGCYYSFSSSVKNANTPSCTFTLTINKRDTTGAILDTWTEDLITAVPQLVELRNNSKLGGNETMTCNAVEYCDDDGWIGFKTVYNSKYSVFPTINQSGGLVQNNASWAIVYTMYNVLTKQWLRVPNPWDAWCFDTNFTGCSVIKKVDDSYIVVTPNGTHFRIRIDTSASEIHKESYARNWCYSGQYYGYLVYPTGIHSSLPICTCDINGKKGKILALRPISAQTRLAAPITKTTLNTMKIQYDFFFKVPLPYMPPEHVWDLYK